MLNDPFIYTTNLTISYIVVELESPDVSIIGLYCNLVDNSFCDVTVYCNFAQLNDLLADEEYAAEAVMLQLSEIIGNGGSGGATMDVTHTGGITFDKHYFCLQQVVEEHTETITSLDEPVYFLLAFIKKDLFPRTEFPFNHIPTPAYTHLHPYLDVLAIQYVFYLHFIQQNTIEDDALTYANLTNKLSFTIAREWYELRLLPKL